VTVDEPYDLLFCDMVIRDKKVTIEVDGPHHYLCNDPSKLLQKDQLTQKVVETYGYKTIRLNVDNFNLMGHDEKKKMFSKLIKQILDTK
jgi:very-short-patch-repair endonuclease